MVIGSDGTPEVAGRRSPVAGCRFPDASGRHPVSVIRFPSSGFRHPLRSGIRYPVSLPLASPR